MALDCAKPYLRVPASLKAWRTRKFLPTEAKAAKGGCWDPLLVKRPEQPLGMLFPSHLPLSPPIPKTDVFADS